MERQLEQTLTANMKAELLRKTIESLERMGGDSLLSGDDSELTNVWEEVCVQVRHEESVFWGTYLDVIEGLLSAQVEQLSEQERMALWMNTDAGADWLADNENWEAEGSAPAVFVGDIVEDLKSDLLSKAADFESSGIARYLHRQYGNDDDLEDEEDGGDENEEEQDVGEEEVVDKEQKPPPTQPAETDIHALFDKALAEVLAEQNAAPGTRHSFNIDEVYSALDEKGKVRLESALQELGKIFGSRINEPGSVSADATELCAGKQPNLTDSPLDASEELAGEDQDKKRQQ